MGSFYWYLFLFMNLLLLIDNKLNLIMYLFVMNCLGLVLLETISWICCQNKTNIFKKFHQLHLLAQNWYRMMFFKTVFKNTYYTLVLEKNVDKSDFLHRFWTELSWKMTFYISFPQNHLWKLFIKRQFWYDFNNGSKKPLVKSYFPNGLELSLKVFDFQW